MFQFLLLFSLLIVCLGFGNQKRGSLYGRNGKVVFIISIMMLGVLAAFRSAVVGNDTQEYVRIYQECKDLIDGESRFEIGYLYYNYILYQISHQPRLLFVVTSLFIFSMYGFFIWKYSQSPRLALTFFFLISYGSAVNTMRQCIAICILLIAIDCLIEKKYVWFVITVLLSSLFHITAIIFLIVFPLSFFHLNGKTLKLFAIGAIIAYFAFADILNIGFSYFTMYEYYSHGKYFEGTTRFASIVKVGFSLLIFVTSYITFEKYTSDKWRKSVEGRRYHILLILALMTLIIDILSLKVNLLDRLDLYFAAMSFVLISNAISLIPSKKKRIITVVLLMLYVSYNCISMTYRPEWNRIYPIELSWTL